MSVEVEKETKKCVCVLHQVEVAKGILLNKNIDEDKFLKSSRISIHN
jgi:hypothetical protein